MGRRTKEGEARLERRDKRRSTARQELPDWRGAVRTACGLRRTKRTLKTALEYANLFQLLAGAAFCQQALILPANTANTATTGSFWWLLAVPFPDRPCFFSVCSSQSSVWTHPTRTRSGRFRERMRPVESWSQLYIVAAVFLPKSVPSQKDILRKVE